MIKAFLEGLEDAERPLLGPNYWMLKKMFLILPKSKIGKAFYIFLQQFITVFVFTQYVELYVVRTDIQKVLMNLSCSMISIIIVIKINSFLMWQDSWIKVIDYVTDADKFERNNKDEVKGKIIDNYTKYCRRVTYFYWMLVFIIVIIFSLTPMIRILSSSVFRDELRNGTELFPHMVSSWMPMDKYHFPGSWITVVAQTIMCAYGSGLMAAYDTNMIVTMVFFGGKFDLLRERSKQMMGSFGKGISEDEAKRVIRQMHTIHDLLSKNLRIFNSVLSPVMFMYILVCALMLCANAFIVTSASNTMQKLQMGVLLLFGIAQLFIFCYHSHDVMLKSESLSMGLYESQWWAADVSQRKSLHILMGKFQITHVFTAGPFTKLTMHTFVTILKGAYSYYALLRK